MTFPTYFLYRVVPLMMFVGMFVGAFELLAYVNPRAGGVILGLFWAVAAFIYPWERRRVEAERE